MRPLFLRLVLGLSVFVLILIVLSTSSSSVQLDQWNPWSSPIVKPTEPMLNPYGDEFLLHEQRSRSATLVIGKLRRDNTSWIEDELQDMPNLKRAVYVVDDNTALLQIPTNKGNEAMVYLSYIIDFYESLSDVSIFMHSHRFAWHNNELLNDGLATDIIKRLSLGKVEREGYVNLRCHLGPGCPGNLKLHYVRGDPIQYTKPDDFVSASFRQLFPHDRLPETLSQPCCAQFAVSKTVIQRRSKQEYIAMRKWLIDTQLGSQWSGRVFEFSWQYIFLATPIFCPSEHMCYCDAYSVCFESEKSWQRYQSILDVMHTLENDLGTLDNNHDRHEEVQRLIAGLRAEAGMRKGEAFLLGADPGTRQRVLSDAWELRRLQGDLR